MSAVTFQDGLAAAEGRPASQGARQSVAALRGHRDPSSDETPTLRALWGRRVEDLAPSTMGDLVVRVLSGRGRLPVGVGLVFRGEVDRIGLYGDCYLALSNWITSWNRQQIKRVA
jgi:hypothetical protein